MDIRLKSSSGTISTPPNEYKDIAAINEVISSYGLKVTETIHGASTVQYRIELPIDLKNINPIMRLKTNICIALNDDNVNYYRQGKDLIIERKGEFNLVYFGDMVNDSVVFRSEPGIKLALGKDIHGDRIYTDLKKAPHMLIAGSTGSGKSELLHSIVASIVYRMPYHPNALAIIDMKGTEFTAYKKTGFVPIISNEKEAFIFLEKMVKFMDQRYEELEKHGYADIDEGMKLGMNPIVIVVDELADLILKNKRVEDELVKIAQKGRAAGIHLVLATQSPRHDVVTGLLKANIPVRVALQTTNGLESRIIMDRQGAENLNGKGDMLFLGRGMQYPIRLQGAYVDNSDKQKIREVLLMNKKKYHAREWYGDNEPQFIYNLIRFFKKSPTR